GRKRGSARGEVLPWKTAQSHIKATPKRVDSQPIATLKPLQCDPKATLKPPQSHLKATPKPPASHLHATLKPPTSYPQARLTSRSCLLLSAFCHPERHFRLYGPRLISRWPLSAGSVTLQAVLRPECRPPACHVERAYDFRTGGQTGQARGFGPGGHAGVPGPH